jgi:hypothetical protein
MSIFEIFHDRREKVLLTINCDSWVLFFNNGFNDIDDEGEERRLDINGTASVFGEILTRIYPANIAIIENTGEIAYQDVAIPENEPFRVRKTKMIGHLGAMPKMGEHIEYIHIGIYLPTRKFDNVFNALQYNKALEQTFLLLKVTVIKKEIEGEKDAVPIIEFSVNLSNPKTQKKLWIPFKSNHNVFPLFWFP